MTKAMNPDVIAVQSKANFNLLVSFANGERKLFDVKPYLEFPVFQRLKQGNYFERAHVENGTVVWDEQADLSPDSLYLLGIPVNL
jgi:Protein of unknown function (DUF2442)